MVFSGANLSKLVVPDSLETIEENTEHQLSFNVMPSKTVTETVSVLRYDLANNFIRSVFNRTYCSEMRDSPDHYVFWSALMQAQKMAYVYMCWRYGFKYDPYDDERMKIWPTKTECKMSSLMSQNDNVTQDVHIQSTKFLGCKDGLGRCDMEILSFTKRKEILIHTTGAIYLSESDYDICTTSSTAL